MSAKALSNSESRNNIGEAFKKGAKTIDKAMDGLFGKVDGFLSKVTNVIKTEINNSEDEDDEQNLKIEGKSTVAMGDLSTMSGHPKQKQNQLVKIDSRQVIKDNNSNGFGTDTKSITPLKGLLMDRK